MKKMKYAADLAAKSGPSFSRGDAGAGRVTKLLKTATCALATLAAVSGCSSAPSAQDEQAGFEASRTPAGAPPWQPFVRGSVWNLRLPMNRQETPLPADGLAVAPFALSDGDYGIKVYFASASDPLWQITYDDYNSVTDNFSPPSPAPVRAPAVIVPPSGTDGTVLVVDEDRQYAYELWRFKVSSSGQSPQGHTASLNIIDLRGDGIHRNVGVTAAGLPGLGGVLRSLEVQAAQPIRHKLWLAVHPDLLHAAAVWPANHFDVPGDGAHAALRYGDVVALSQSYDVKRGECGLSPLFQRLAQGLQDFGGIVQDRGGDSIGVVAEIGSVASHLDVDEAAMFGQLGCLRKYLVRVDDPWTGAPPGGLGY
jgi:hypothetical protein